MLWGMGLGMYMWNQPKESSELTIHSMLAIEDL